ncbi:hypothetical protein NLU66_05330 [Brachybacterium sp. NBEC-018]|uniref:hypothetical protein n=1 Tax=Brachybacterium sp. NBEC-018 TaxID=2996004 RepID=UPI00217565AA|nr:hypothetical protein [Brachybacterium sp. NBEC-018]UVY85023.1 hypothetical protein NLU66_05330 [Brachybacterium sp. NBEC-018]
MTDSTPADAAPRDPAPDAEDEAAFGEREPNRFGADVEYRGRAQGHEYVARVRHRLLDTSLLLEIDGVPHDPAAEEKALKAAEKIDGPEGDEAAEGDEGPTGADDLRFRIDDGFATLRCTVIRRDSDGEHTDHELVTVRTAGLGGAGEVEVSRGPRTDPLIPAEGSPSALRDEKRAAHPTWFAAFAAVRRAAGYLIPLLGLGALFSNILRPVREWVASLLRPVAEAVGAVVNPVLEVIGDLLRPVGDLLAAVLRPVARARDWLRDLLLGWIPDLSLPFSVPEWVPDVVVPLIVVLLVFSATLSGIRRRSAALKEARKEPGGSTDAPDEREKKRAAAQKDDAEDASDGEDSVETS